MIAQLIRQFGLEIADAISPPSSNISSLERQSYGVFHVESAAGSPYIPAQAEFVARYGVRSVVGCGGALRNGDLFALILFARVPVSREVADRFRALALEVKSVLFFYGDDAVFTPERATPA